MEPIQLVGISATSWLQFGGLLVILIGLIGGLHNRHHQEKGIGIRLIQWTLVVLALPILFILGLEGVISSESITALFGTVIGYVLAGISVDDMASG
jgi:hypothetical protein